MQEHNLSRPNRTAETITGLVPLTDYFVWLVAYTEVGVGPESEHVIATTGEPSKSLSGVFCIITV